MKPRVLLIGNFLSGHGLGTTVGEELARRLAAGGWPVATASSKKTRLARLADMQRAVWREDCDVAQIDVYSGRAFRWAELAAWGLERRGLPFVLTLHGGALPEMAAQRPERVRRLLTAARAVTTPSRYLLDAMAELRDDLELMPNALDLSLYRYRERTEPCPRLVWVRAFHEVYHPQLAPRVLGKLHRPATLLMVGPDKGELAATRREIARLGLGESVEIVAGVAKTEVPAQLERGDVFLNTARIDNTPVTVLEAMASGLPVVSTDAGGIRHLIVDGDDGLVVPRDDAGAMAAAVRRLLDEPGLAAALAARARRKVEPFDWSSVLPRWEELLLRCARR